MSYPVGGRSDQVLRLAQQLPLPYSKEGTYPGGSSYGVSRCWGGTCACWASHGAGNIVGRGCDAAIAGPIPDTLGYLTALEGLDLGSNKLTGEALLNVPICSDNVAFFRYALSLSSEPFFLRRLVAFLLPGSDLARIRAWIEWIVALRGRYGKSSAANRLRSLVLSPFSSSR